MNYQGYNIRHIVDELCELAKVDVHDVDAIFLFPDKIQVRILLRNDDEHRYLLDGCVASEIREVPVSTANPKEDAHVHRRGPQ